MSDSVHSHNHDHDLVVGDTVKRALWGSTAVLGLIAVIGLILWWPFGTSPYSSQIGVSSEYRDGTVTRVEYGSCPGQETDLNSCQHAVVRLDAPGDEPGLVDVYLYDTEVRAPKLKPQDEIVIRVNANSVPEFRYTYLDFQRAAPLGWLAALFVLVVVVVGRRKGVLALLGLIGSAVLLIEFTVPSLLRGNPAIGVAFVTAILIAFLALFLAHGFSTTTTVAVLGTLSAVAVVLVLAWVFVDITHLTGLIDEYGQVLSAATDTVDLRSLIIAGTVVGALGVLDDVTVTQVSAVGELHEANSSLGVTELYQAAMRIGRDHITSTVNTLVLAYVATSLPLILVFSESPDPAGRLISREVVAIEIIRTLAGSIGLILSIPATTFVAALVVTRGHHSHSDLDSAEPQDEPGDYNPPDSDLWDNFSPRG